MLKDSPIVIVGMARSGTALVSHVLGSLPNVHTEIEPHALWKSNNFKYLNDEEYDITEKIVKNIREKLTNNLNGQRLVEKSPINSLRPYLVHVKNLQEELNPLLQNSDFSFKVSFIDVGDKKEKSIKNSV